ncbi:MAG: alpha/beta hydrolase [Chloroflexi bacterium CFX2]|nr:alpha/beta hydrolase [Chloroflexi bacterium CFX2]
MHANGYPPECYSPLFEHLQKKYRVFGMKLRPLWDGASREGLKDWHPYSDDFLEFLSNRASEPVIGVGHSIGGVVTLRAAMKAPEKFRALVLLDPVLIVPPFMAAWNLVRAIGLGERTHPLISAAKKRRRVFDDLDLVFERYREREIFRYMNDESLKFYIKGITKPKVDGGYELVYSPEWEVHIYLTGLRDFDLWRNLPRFEAPTLIIRGAETDTFSENAEKLIKKKNPGVRVVTMQKATHLLPLEHPHEVAQIIDNFVRPERI